MIEYVPGIEAVVVTFPVRPDANVDVVAFVHISEKKIPAQLPKTIVGNTVSTKASHITNDAACIYMASSML